MLWAPSTWWIPKLVEVLHRITAPIQVCCHRIISSSLPLLSFFFPTCPNSSLGGSSLAVVQPVDEEPLSTSHHGAQQLLQPWV